jgi:hypothetical protein
MELKLQTQVQTARQYPSRNVTGHNRAEDRRNQHGEPPVKSMLAHHLHRPIKIAPAGDDKLDLV